MKTDYSVSNCGNIYSNKFNKRIKLKPNKIKGGYLIVRLYVDGVMYDRLVSVLVGEYFVPNPDNKPQINHKNGNKLINNDWNLEWTSQSENIQHAYKTGLMSKTYKDCYNAKLNELDVKNIRIMLYNNEKQRSIAKTYNISEQVISSIKHNRSYKNIGLIDREFAININSVN
ncbi:MAG: endodeoxyribonuclease [Candidatus Paceibacterota bacterium]